MQQPMAGRCDEARAARRVYWPATRRLSAPAMVVVTESVHPRSLDFANQRKVVILRDQGYQWRTIAQAVVNLQGEQPSLRLCRTVYAAFNRSKGRRVYKYNRCGRNTTVFTLSVRRFLIRRLRALRTKVICTAAVLQAELAKAMHIDAEVSGIRKLLRAAGYKWVPRRSHKRKYSEDEKRARVAFARSALNLTAAQLRARLACAMDGVVIIIPPAEPTARSNHVHGAERYIWRRPNEARSAELAGKLPYEGQAPPSRCVGLWGACSADGFAEVLMSGKRKVTGAEWADAVDAGKLSHALLALNPARRRGPWSVLCDNESFLRSPPARAAHRRAAVELWKMPPRSPDLNPIEKYWSWLRRRIHKQDLQDLRQGKPVPGRMAYIARIRAINRSVQAQAVAARCAQGFRKVCRLIDQNKGIAVHA